MSVPVAVIIPAYNEAETLAKVIDGLGKFSVSVIVVDDGSTDATFEIAKPLAHHVLRHPVNLGKGAAMKTGAEYAFGRLNAQSIVFLDGDGQHDPEELAQFLKHFGAGEQILFGVRQLAGDMPPDRILGNRFVSWAAKALFGGPYLSDILSGYKGFTQKAYEQLRWEASGYEVELEIAARILLQQLPVKMIQIRTVYLNLQRGMNVLDSLSVLRYLLTLRLRLSILRR